MRWATESTELVKATAISPVLADDPAFPQRPDWQPPSPPDPPKAPTIEVPIGLALEEIKVRAIQATVEYAKGDKNAAAVLLDISPVTVRKFTKEV